METMWTDHIEADLPHMEQSLAAKASCLNTIDTDDYKVWEVSPGALGTIFPITYTVQSPKTKSIDTVTIHVIGVPKRDNGQFLLTKASHKRTNFVVGRMGYPSTMPLDIDIDMAYEAAKAFKEGHNCDPKHSVLKGVILSKHFKVVYLVYECGVDDEKMFLNPQEYVWTTPEEFKRIASKDPDNNFPYYISTLM